MIFIQIYDYLTISHLTITFKNSTHENKLINNKLIIFCFLAICNINAYSTATVTLTKTDNNVPDNVCDLSAYNYIATVSGVTGSYTLSFVSTYETATVVSTTTNGYITTWNIKWTANTGTNGNKGEIKAKLRYDNTDYYSDPLAVTIKSIKHLTATFTGIPYNPTWNLSPCEQGTITLEAGTMDVPGTGTINPERVNSFEWFVPAEWTVNGVPSTGTWIKTSPNVTITYPKSGTNGTIKVRASYLTACGGDVQQSIESSAITVNRSTTLTLTPSVSFIQCGDVSPITYTITPTLPCAVYYWNNSQTPTTSNSYQFTPDGHSPINVTVTIVYGTSTPQIKTSTMNYVLFAPGVTPKIVGSAVICTSNYQYSVSDLRPGYNVLWTLDPKIQKVSESNNVVTVRSTSSGTASISATITSNCGTYSPDPTKTVWIG